MLIYFVLNKNLSGVIDLDFFCLLEKDNMHDLRISYQKSYSLR